MALSRGAEFNNGRRLQDLDLRPWPATSNQRAEPLVLRMGAALPCLRGDRPPRHPPPMARPPPPRLNVEAQPSHPLPNEYEWARIPNFPFNYGKAPTPPAPLCDAACWRCKDAGGARRRPCPPRCTRTCSRCPAQCDLPADHAGSHECGCFADTHGQLGPVQLVSMVTRPPA